MRRWRQSARCCRTSCTARCVRKQWSCQHVPEFSATLARIIGIPPEAARLQFERRHTQWRSIDAELIGEQQRTADFCQKVGRLKQRFDVRQTFDPGFSLSA